jgi:hypothetical protein
MAAELTPKDPALRRAEIGRYPDTGKPYTLELELAAAVPVAELAAALGPYQQGRTDRGMPRELIFSSAGAPAGASAGDAAGGPASDGPWRVVVIAQVPPGSSPLAEQAASVVVLRRDPR